MTPLRPVTLNCDEYDKAALDEKTKPFAKREIIQLIHQIIKDKMLLIN